MGAQQSAASARFAIIEAGQHDVAHLRSIHPGATNWRADIVDFNKINSTQYTGTIRYHYTLPLPPRSPNSHSPLPSPPGEVLGTFHYLAVPRSDGAKDEDTGEKLWAAQRIEADASNLAATAAAIKAGTASGKNNKKKGVADISYPTEE